MTDVLSARTGTGRQVGAGVAGADGPAARTSRGAYGLAVAGALGSHPALRLLDLPKATLHLGESNAAAEEVGSGDARVGPGHVRIRLADDTVLDARDAGGGRFDAVLTGGPSRTADDLVHPYLAPIAALVHRWRGVPALHGAAVGSAQGLVGLIGGREHGKTTTAAALVQERGMTLYSDDLLVVEDGEVLPGPLSLDLRPAGSELLGLGGDRVRGGERIRRLAPPAPESGSHTLRMCVHLEFGAETRVLPLPAAQRLHVLGSQLYWPGIGSPAQDLLALVALPQVVLQRPRGRQGLTEALDVLCGLLEKG